MYITPPAFRRTTLVNVPTAADVADALANLQCEHNWMKCLGIVHAAIGIIYSNVIADNLFEETSKIVLRHSRQLVDINNHGRYIERFTRFVDLYARQSVVNRIMAGGVGVPGTPLQDHEIADIIAATCHVRVPFMCMLKYDTL